MIKVASLCSGYGGLEMGLRLWLGDQVRVTWHAENNADAERVLKTHWPDVPNRGDFTTLDFWPDAPHADLHAGGVPCQPFSAAGRKRGAADDRFLWPYWLDGIGRHRPATVVFENVQGLTQGKMRPIFDSIIADLLAMGYDVRWCLLGACAVGACHHRHRVFLLACRTRTTPHARQVTVQTCGQHGSPYLPSPRSIDGIMGPSVTRSGDRRGEPNNLSSVSILFPSPMARDGDGRGEGEADYWEHRAETRSNGLPLGAVAALLPTPRANAGAERAGTGRTPAGTGQNAQGGPDLQSVLNMLPTPQHHDGRPGSPNLSVDVAQRRHDAGRRNLEDGVALLPTPRGSDARNGGPNQGIASGDVALSSAVIGERFGKYAAAVERQVSVTGVLPPEPTEIGPRGGRRLAAAFSEWMMMIPAGHVTSVLERGPALERCGNGVVPLQAATALRLLFDDLVS
jgi:DNA (cytosine-5)-methyltransferase 1